MNRNIKENVTRGSIWLRLIPMIVLGIAFNLAEIVAIAIVVFQFLSSLLTGNTNENLTRFSRNLAQYLQQIVMFVTLATEEKPFPFSAWGEELQEEIIELKIDNKLASPSKNNEDAANAAMPTKVAKKPATRRSSRPKKTPPSSNNG